MPSDSGRVRRAVPLVVLALVASSVGVVALASASHDAKAPTPPGANAGRFLHLTGDSPVHGTNGKGHAAAGADGTGSLPVVGGAMPTSRSLPWKGSSLRVGDNPPTDRQPPLRRAIGDRASKTMHRPQRRSHLMSSGRK